MAQHALVPELMKCGAECAIVLRTDDDPQRREVEVPTERLLHPLLLPHAAAQTRGGGPVDLLARQIFEKKSRDAQV